jgi:hypothetical protein
MIEAMDIQELHEATVALEREIEEAPPGAPELAAVVARIAELQDQLERARSVLGALVPDSSSPKSADEESAIYLERMLRSLMQAATAKR